MSQFSKTVLYFLWLVTGLNFFSVAYPNWRFFSVGNWRWTLAAGLLLLAWQSRRHWSEISRAIPGLFRHARLPLLIVVLVLLANLNLLTQGMAFLNSDADMLVLPARQIALDGSRPIYIYNQFYQGTAISYFYSLLFRLIGNLHIAVCLINILFFSLGVWFSGRLFKKISGDGFYLLLLGTMRLDNLMLLITDTVRGFPLVFFLMAYLIDAAYDNLCTARKKIFWPGVAAGLFLFQYQQALPFILVLAALILFHRLKEGLLPGLGLWIAGFVAGAFPHLLAEIYNHFLNTRNMFLSKSGNLWMNIRNIKNFIAHFIFHPLYMDEKVFSWLFFSLFLIGFGLALYIGFIKKERRALFLPALYLMAVMISALSGVSPGNDRFGVHFRIYAPLALFFIALAFTLIPTRGRKAARIILAIVWVAFVGLREAESWKFSRRDHRLNQQTVKMLDHFPGRLIYGNYHFASKFQSNLALGKIILVAGSRGPWNYRAFGQYLPDYLIAAGEWAEADKGFLAQKENEEHFAELLTRLHIRYKIRRGGMSSYFFNFNPEPTPELFHFLALTERMGGVAWEILQEGLPRPWEEIGAMTIAGDCLRISLAKPQAGEKKFPDFRLQLCRDGLSLEVPLIFSDGSMEWRLPAGTVCTPGAWTVACKWMDLVLHREEKRLEWITAAAGAPLLETDLADAQEVYFTLHNEKKLAVQVREQGLNVVFRSWVSSDRLYNGVTSEIRAMGAPLLDTCHIGLRDPRISRLTLTFISLVDFESMAWTRRFDQFLEVRSSQGRAEEAISLSPGLQQVSLLVSAGEMVTLRTRQASFFAAVDRAQNKRLLRTGLLLLKITCLDTSGKVLGEIQPYLKRNTGLQISDRH